MSSQAYDKNTGLLHKVAGIPRTLINKIIYELKAVSNYYGAKNLIPYPYSETTKTQDGIAFTDNGDGTVSVSGTTTDNPRFYFQNIADKYYLEAGKTYTLSQGFSASDSSKYQIEIALYNGTTFTGYVRRTNTNDGTITFTTPTNVVYDRVTLYILVLSGAVISTPITFKPMLRLASIQDDTWVPYAKTNKELTDDVSDVEEIANNASTAASSAVSTANTARSTASSASSTASTASTNATRALNIARSTSSFPTGDAYSSSSAYKVGDMVIYSNTLYRCKTACSAASWSVNARNFESISLASAITDLNNDLNKQFKAVTEYSKYATINSTLPYNSSYLAPKDGLYAFSITGASGAAGAIYRDSARLQPIFNNATQNGVQVLVALRENDIIYTRNIPGSAYYVFGYYYD